MFRLISFWLGLPVLLFLLWGWWDSVRYYSDLKFLEGKSYNTIAVHCGTVYFQRYDEIDAMNRIVLKARQEGRGFAMSRTRWDFDDVLFPPAFGVSKRSKDHLRDYAPQKWDESHHLLGVALWMLALVYTGAWVAFLGWRLSIRKKGEAVAEISGGAPSV